MAAYANLKSKISLDSTEFKAGIRRVKLTAAAASRTIGKGFRSMGAGLGKLAGMLTGITKNLAKFAAIAAGITFAAAIAGAAKLAQGLKGAFDAGGALSDLASRTGIAVKELVILQQAFEDNGIAAEKVGSIINKMQKGITDFGSGLSTQVRAFEKLGITYDEIAGKSPLEQFKMLQQALNRIEDPTLRAGTAMEIFGRSGGELQALFGDTGALDKAAVTIGKQAEILDKNSARFDRIADLLASAGTKLQGFFVGMADQAAPQILEVLERFNTMDFASIGQRFANAFSPANLSSTISTLSELVASAMGDALKVAFEYGYAVLRGILSPEGLSFIGENVIKVFQTMGQALADVWLKMFDYVKAQWTTGEAVAWDNPTGEGEAKKESGGDFLKRISEEIGGVKFNMSDKTKALFDKIANQGAVTAKTEADLYEKERQEQKRRIAEDEAKMRSVSGHANAPIDIHGPPRPSDAILGKNRLSNKIEGLKTGGFGGLAGLNQMQLDKLNKVAPGANTALSGNRPMLQGSGGLRTGSLGDVRRVGQKATESSARKEDTLASTNQYLTDQIGILQEQTAILREGLQ